MNLKNQPIGQIPLNKNQPALDDDDEESDKPSGSDSDGGS